MSISTSIEKTFFGSLVRPVGASGVPALAAQVALAAGSQPRGRGAYVPSLGIIFMAKFGTGSLLRFDTVNNVQLADLPVTGAPLPPGSLKGVVYNASNGFLYSIDPTLGAPNGFWKINPVTGGGVLLGNGAFGSLNNDIFYLPLTTSVYGGANGGIIRVDSAGLFSVIQGGSPSGSVKSMDFSAINSFIACSALGSDFRMDPVAMTWTRTVDGLDHCSISYGSGSKMCLSGSNDNRVNGIQVYDALLETITNLVAVTTGQFNSGSFSSRLGIHFMVETLVGQVWMIADAPLGSILKKTAIGACTLEVNDSWPVDTGSAVYIPSGTALQMNIFK